MLIVQKYGGTSVADPEKIRVVAEKAVRAKKAGNSIVIVVSAMGRTTDNLLKLAKKVNPNPPTRELDLLLSTGEIVTAALLCMSIEDMGCEAEGFPGFLAGIQTDSTHTKARIKRIVPKRILEELRKKKIVVIAGFQGISAEANITTLGRGGSDLTAIALAGALEADKCEIYTDVEGVFTADPKIVPEARIIPEIAYEEMLEMAATGAKVMQARAVEFAQKYKIQFIVRSTFSDKGGTMVKEIELREGVVVTSATLDENQAKITFFRVPDKPGVAAEIFGSLGKEHINVDMIVQNVGRDNFADISFTVGAADTEKTLKISRRIGGRTGCTDVNADSDIAKITIVGLGMMNHPGVAARMFKALSDEKVNIEMISTSEIRISCLVRKKHAKKGLKAVHREFFKTL